MLKRAAAVVVGAVVTTATCSGASQQQNLKYERRGSGSSERREGTLAQPVSAKLYLVSATAVKAPFSGKASPTLYVRFLMPAAGEAHVRASDISSKRSYLMIPVRTQWTAGWVAFGPWPLDDVVVPLGIPSQELGVVVTKNPSHSLSGRVFPALVTASDAPGQISKYDFVIRSDTSLTSIIWDVRNETNVVVASGPSRRLAAGQPYTVSMAASSWADGVYRLSFKGDVSTPDDQSIVRKQFEFAHARSFPARQTAP